MSEPAAAAPPSTACVRARPTAEAPLRALTPPVEIDGVYDDHDYGENDGGKHYPHREASRQLFLDHIGVPAESPRRSQPGGSARSTARRGLSRSCSRRGRT